MNIKPTIILLLVFLFSSCAAYFNQPVGIEKAIYGENTPATSSLLKLPKPKEPVVVGVYKFKDQTGQYKAIEQGSTFSTAVTQGATSILIKALGDSKWFVPVHRQDSIYPILPVRTLPEVLQGHVQCLCPQPPVFFS